MSFTTEFSICPHRFNAEVIDFLGDYPFAENRWPVVYLLKETGKKKLSAYVGETVDIITRLTTHLSHPDKCKLHEVLLISGNKFNKSATLDIEANCIKYLSGDGGYKLLNANLGLRDHDYYQKEELYSNIFRSIWEKLLREKVVKHTLRQIDNSDLFKYSPYKSLSEDQTKSLILILKSLLDDNYKSIVIEGGAGSGKTVLAVFLFKLLHTPTDDFNFGAFGPEDMVVADLVLQLKSKLPNPKMALVIAVDSFRSTVQKIFRNVEGLNAAMVVGPAGLRKNTYDIVLVDEAHRLRQRKNLGSYFGVFDITSEALGFDKEKNHELDWVLKQSAKNILFYDEFQSVRPSDVPQKAFDSLKNSVTTKTEYLYSQFRVKGGAKYVKFITCLLNGDVPRNTEKIKIKNYEFLLFHDLQQMIDQIREKERTEQLARTLAGFAWPWVSKKGKKKVKRDFDIEIGTIKLKWNSVNKDWINSPDAIREVGCIHTVQGYDLNYAGIILGNEIGYDRERGEIIIRRENYFDKNGKNGVKNTAQLKSFIINIYKTMMLRGIKGTYLYVCDEALREYFSKYIPVFGESDTIDTAKESVLKPYVNCVPLYDLSAAAGSFSEQQRVSAETIWYPVEDGIAISKDHFACKVVGESMNKEIPNGAICLFRKYSGGTRNGEIVLVALTDRQDVDFGSSYTVKKYFSKKKQGDDGYWEHEQIILKPLSTNPFYKNILLEGNELTLLEVIGIFEKVL
ncbi:DNA/RNA helicase domain-containing protein [Chitinophaga qingshengii]|uniref:DUF2075 domain-containing protein n=1 Tax=Chitinophaga qingshengii TaxID=1569794 RepID=A0ABR7TLL0_9BACT|nr:DNA/RNA helicase domain-containing protein [Chitinophaga qingshengii]MBC9930299.1 DUF2075 domain-containing protein [Chitinophaga qingshengii]